MLGSDWTLRHGSGLGPILQATDQTVSVSAACAALSSGRCRAASVPLRWRPVVRRDLWLAPQAPGADRRARAKPPGLDFPAGLGSGFVARRGPVRVRGDTPRCALTVPLVCCSPPRDRQREPRVMPRESGMHLVLCPKCGREDTRTLCEGQGRNLRALSACRQSIAGVGGAARDARERCKTRGFVARRAARMSNARQTSRRAPRRARDARETRRSIFPGRPGWPCAA
jgi:hypothetical protein